MAKIWRVAMLGSGQGSVIPLLWPQLEKLPVRVVAGVSDWPERGFLAKLRQRGVPGHGLPVAGRTRPDYDQALSCLLASYWPDLILMIGYMRIAGPDFVKRWQGRVFNVHPSLLPRHAGLIDLAVHRAVLAAGERESGCSLHRVTDVVDGGEVLVQKRCPVLAGDDAASLKKRVQQLEASAWLELLQKFCEGDDERR